MRRRINIYDYIKNEENQQIIQKEININTAINSKVNNLNDLIDNLLNSKINSLVNDKINKLLGSNNQVLEMVESLELVQDLDKDLKSNIEVSNSQIEHYIDFLENENAEYFIKNNDRIDLECRYIKPVEHNRYVCAKLYENYLNWCKFNGERSTKKSWFKKNLLDNGFIEKRTGKYRYYENMNDKDTVQ